MNDYVSKNEIIKVLNTMHRYVADELTLCDTEKKFPRNEVFIVDDVYEEIIEQLPPADIRENTHGTWEHWEGEKFFDVPVCSNCGMTFSINARGWSFCPNCGDDKRSETN